MSYMNRTLPYINAFGTVDISTANSVDEALHISGMDWNVSSKFLYDENGNEYPNFRANINDSTGDLLGIVSDKYSIVQNKEAFEFVNELTSEGFKFEKAGTFKNGKSIWVMGKFDSEDILGDSIDNNVVFVNSHDGSSGVKVMMTPVRVICANMLNLALKRAERSWTTKHTRSIYSRLEEAKHTLGLVNHYMTELKDEAERLAYIKITDDKIDEIFDKLFPVDPNNDSERKIKNVSFMKDSFIKCYNEQDIAQFKGTVYGAINAMSDLISHKQPNRITANYYENSWNNLINGNHILDGFYKEFR